MTVFTKKNCLSFVGKREVGEKKGEDSQGAFIPPPFSAVEPNSGVCDPLVRFVGFFFRL